MGIILPLLYLGAGFGLAMLLPEHWGNRLKEGASTLLTRWIIPAVIIYTVATSRPELFFVATSTMVLMLLGVLCAGRITRDSVQKLAFVYLNAGLFGIPVVAGFWGEEAVRVYIGAYIGNSIMGNILGTSLLRGGSGIDPRVGESNGTGCTSHKEPWWNPPHGAAGPAYQPARYRRGNRSALPACGLFPEPVRGGFLPGAHLDFQLYRTDCFGHVARRRQTAPRRPDPRRRMGVPARRARERLQRRRAGVRPLGARRCGRAL